MQNKRQSARKSRGGHPWSRASSGCSGCPGVCSLREQPGGPRTTATKPLPYWSSFDPKKGKLFTKMFQVSVSTAMTLIIKDKTKPVGCNAGWRAAGPPPAAAVLKRRRIFYQCSGMTNISRFLGGLAPSHLPVLAHYCTMSNIKTPQSKHKIVLKA